MSDERLQRLEDKVDGIGTSVTRLTTTLDLIFDPETGQFQSVKKKVDEHEKFITKANWTIRLAGIVGIGGLTAKLRSWGIL